MNKKVLIVEDDKKTAHLIQVYLEKDGYQVATAQDGRQAVDLARRVLPDIIILDLMLPEIDGIDVCRLLRAESKVPIIILTARATEEDKLQGLEVGADDYVTKPFSPRELVARVRAVLRRTVDDEERGVEVGDLAINFTRHEVTSCGQVVDLTPTEFKVLEILARSPGRVFTRMQLIDQALGLNFEGLERTIDVHVLNLRRKIESDASHPRFVKTVFGVGYKLEAKANVQ